MLTNIINIIQKRKDKPPKLAFNLLFEILFQILSIKKYTLITMNKKIN